MTNLLTDTSTSFKSELQSKQSLIDQTHTRLREASSLLAAERRRLSSLQRRATERKSLRQKIANIHRANESLRSDLASTGSSPSDLDPGEQIKIGEADAGLVVDAIRLPPNPDSGVSPIPAQLEYLASLPSSDILQARVAAYVRNNARLSMRAKALQSRSSELEVQLRRVVVLCTGVGEEKVDEMVEGLVAAVESERGEDVEVGRVREFLRRVERRGE